MNNQINKKLQEKVESLLSQMTIEEKVAQMQQLSVNATPEDIFKDFKNQGTIGSYLHVLGEETGDFAESVEKSRLKIIFYLSKGFVTITDIAYRSHLHTVQKNVLPAKNANKAEGSDR